MEKKRVVVTGLGVVAPNGIGVQNFWTACLQGRSGIVPVSTFDTAKLQTRIAGEISAFDPEDYIPAPVAKRVDRFVHLGLAATKMALEDSRLNLNTEDKTRWGAVIGSGLGGQMFHEMEIAHYIENERYRVNPISVARVSPNSISGNIAIQYGLRGPNGVISTACASGTQGIGEAFRKIQYGEADLMITGGAEAPLTKFNFDAYNSLRVMSRGDFAPGEASRPFDKQRNGFVMGEGAAILVIEALEHARRRNAPIYGEIRGYGLTCDAHNMVMPKPDGKDAARAMQIALDDAQFAPEAIGYINAHGTSTQINDTVETIAIKRVFGEGAYRIPISSIKSMIGHSLGAAGAIEAVACCLTLKHQCILPTINYRHPDPECDLDYVPNESREAIIHSVLSNSFGFGGVNACLIITEYK
jgi:3-oxoacyl-[acyl-carrier-protein] synthase II